MAAFVQVWFFCDVEGCSCKAEMLVETRTHREAQRVYNYRSDRWGSGLPGGWIEYGIRELLNDVLLCPEHAWIAAPGREGICVHLFDDKHLWEAAKHIKREYLKTIAKLEKLEAIAVGKTVSPSE